MTGKLCCRNERAEEQSVFRRCPSLLSLTLMSVLLSPLSLQAADNRGGTLNSLQELTVSTGAMDNRGGTVGAKTTADLSTTSLDNREGGRLVSEGELRLHTGGLQNSHGQIQSVGDILFDSVRGVVDNVSGLIRSGSAITLNALQFINRGLIDGKYTHLQVNTLTNSGTGRIYGDAVGVSAATFNNLDENGVAATLAGRERVDLGVQTLNNRTHSLIYSAGDMYIGGMLDANGAATGKAGVLNNHSATIEAAGYLVLSAGQINNVNDHFTTERVVVSTEKVTEYQHRGSDVRWNAKDEGVFIDNNSSDGLLNLNTPDDTGHNNDRFTKYEYTRTVEETRVKDSDPGKILSGAGMTVVADKLLNDKSQVVAGGLLDMQAGDPASLVSDVAAEYTRPAGNYYRSVQPSAKNAPGHATG